MILFKENGQYKTSFDETSR